MTKGVFTEQEFMEEDLCLQLMMKKILILIQSWPLQQHWLFLLLQQTLQLNQAQLKKNVFEATEPTICHNKRAHIKNENEKLHNCPKCTF